MITQNVSSRSNQKIITWDWKPQETIVWAGFSKLCSALTRRSRHLLDLTKIQATCTLLDYRYVGRQMVELTAIINCLGDSRGDIIWEAPLKHQQVALILHCGPNVSLGNIIPRDVLGLETLRCGLRFETFRYVAQGMAETEMEM